MISKSQDISLRVCFRCTRNISTWRYYFIQIIIMYFIFYYYILKIWHINIVIHYYLVEYYYHMSALQLIRAVCTDTDDCEGDFYQCLMRILPLKLLIENHCFKLESLMTKSYLYISVPLFYFHLKTNTSFTSHQFLQKFSHVMLGWMPDQKTEGVWRIDWINKWKLKHAKWLNF